MSRRKIVKLVMGGSVLKELRERDRSGDEISRQMSERARKILSDEPVESVAMRINYN